MMATLPKLPMLVPCSHYRYEGTSYGCAVRGECQPIQAGADVSACPDFHNPRRAQAAAARAAKPHLSIDELAAKKRRCREAKARGEPCTEFSPQPKFSSPPQRGLASRVITLRNIPGHFNCGIIEWQGKILLASRKGWTGSVWLSVLGEDYQPVKSWQLDLRHPRSATGKEDPRLFVFQGKLHLMFTGYAKPHPKETSVMLARLADDFSVERVWMPEFSGRRAWEKNWQFFEHDGGLYCVYLISPHIILKANGDTLKWFSETHHGFTLPGRPDLRGGAPPVIVGDEFYHWFHTHSLDSDDVDRYCVGLCAFDAKPPFGLTRVVKRTLVEPDAGKLSPAGARVVYPCGALLRNGQWLVSYGANDLECRIAFFDQVAIEEVLSVWRYDATK